MEDVIIEYIIKKKVKRAGHSSHVILPRQLEGSHVYILVINEDVIRPKIHKNRIKKTGGETYYQAEITTNAGTHSFWIKKEDIKKMFTR